MHFPSKFVLDHVDCRCQCGATNNKRELEASGAEIYQCEHCGVLRVPDECSFCGAWHLIPAGQHRVECSCGKAWDYDVKPLRLVSNWKLAFWRITECSLPDVSR